LKAWIDETLARLLGRWVGLVQLRAPWVAALVLGAAAAAVLYAATHLGVNAETEELFSKDLAFRRHEIEFERAFPEFDNDLLILVNAPTAEGARQATEALSDALRAEPERYPEVFVPGGGPFFERHGLLYFDIEQLEELGDHLARAQPLLAELARDPSLRGLFGLLEGALGADVELESQELDAMFERVSRAIDAAAEDRDEAFFFESLLLGSVVEDGRRRLVVAKPAIDFAEFLPGQEPIDRVYELVRELRLEERSGASVRVTGDLALETEELGVVRGQAALAGLASFLAVSVILFLALGSLRLILATVITLLAGLALTGGFAALAIGHLNLLSVAFAVLFIGLAVDFGIHFVLRYRELLAGGESPGQALQGSGARVGTSLVLCALTTAIGFYSFVPTGYVGVAELGVITGTGMFISLACTLTLLPALLTVFGAGGGVAPARERSFELRLPRFPVRHPQVVRAVTALLALAALFALPGLRFDANPLAVRDPGAQSVIALRELLADSTTSPWGVDVLAADRESAEVLARRLGELATVAHTVTLSNLVPEAQSEKQQLLEEITFFLALPPEGEALPAPGASETRSALQALHSRARAVAGDESQALAGNARRLADALDALVEDPAALAARLQRLEHNLLPSLQSSLRRLERALAPGTVSVETLPQELRRRFLTEDGRVRVQAYPKADLDDSDALEAFVSEVGEITPAGVGGAVRIVESARTTVRALRRAFLLAVVAIGILLFLLWRRLTETALVLAPLLLAGLFTCAASVLLDLPLNFADVIVLPLLLGIGVDSGIHLVHRHRHLEEGADLLGTSTARAVFWSALTTVASFGSLGLSTHAGMASLGQLLTLGVALTLLCNLVVLPALLGRSRRAR
jgi:hopanoid biosynthesis associated RND transporter like protein HpnN